MEKLGCVGVTQCFGHSVHHVEAAIVAEDGANFEALAAVEVPRLAVVRFVADDDGASQWSNWCGVKVEGEIEMLPRGHLGGEGLLPQEVQSELCLWYQVVPEIVGKGVRDSC